MKESKKLRKQRGLALDKGGIREQNLLQVMNRKQPAMRSVKGRICRRMELCS
jgi:hypothetical protein